MFTFVGKCCNPFITAAKALLLSVPLILSGCSDLGPPGAAAPSAQVIVPQEPASAASTPRVRLITGQQYLNMVSYLFGTDIKVTSPFAPLKRTDGLLHLGAASAGIASGQVQKFQRAASSIAAQVVDAGSLERQTPSHRDYLIPCKPVSEKAADNACAAEFLKKTGRLLYRRPLDDAKLAELVDSAGQIADRLNNFYAGLATVLEGMLVSPEVLFIAEGVEPDPTRPGRQRLDAYSLASRLSFFLWNAPPDDALLKTAESGALHIPQERARIVDAMIASPRLEQGIHAFFDDMLGFDDFGKLAKEAGTYPLITGAALADSRAQTLRTAYDHLVTENRDYRDMFTSRRTFISPALGAVYRVPTGPGWVSYEFPEESLRYGMLTQISFLALHAHPARSSPTLRGKALRELLLCQKVPAPPPDVDFSAVEDPDADYRTARERLTAHQKNPACAGCHKITDPMGLALENFDGAGQYRSDEKGAVIDVSGSLDGRSFNDVKGLAEAIRDHKALPTCFVRRIYSYGTGGPLSARDKEALEYFNNAFAAQGYKVPALLRTIATSEAFSTAYPDQPSSGAP